MGSLHSSPCRCADMLSSGLTISRGCRDYQEEMLASQVQPELACSTSGAPTASCHCLITPDGERTMRTCLGAATELVSVQQLPAGWADGLQLLHCEGYCLWRPQLAVGAMRAAREAGAQVGAPCVPR